MSFAHLHVHTEYSLLDGSNKIKEYVSRVKELGMNSAAITDHGRRDQTGSCKNSAGDKIIPQNFFAIPSLTC